VAPPPETVPRPAGRRIGAHAALAAAGFYGGLLQVGVGFVLLAIFAGVLRLDLVRGNALKTAVVAAYSVVALAVFAATGRVAWWHGLVLASGSVVGAQAGVRFAVKRGAEVVRKVTVVAVLAVAAAVAARWF
jgi:uncharacterized membrane protein YfcA